MTKKPIVVTSEKRAHFYNKELKGIPNAFAYGDLQAVVVCQYWADGECANAYHIETDEQRRAIIMRLHSMIDMIERGRN